MFLEESKNPLLSTVCEFLKLSVSYELMCPEIKNKSNSRSFHMTLNGFINFCSNLCTNIMGTVGASRAIIQFWCESLGENLPECH